MAIAHASDRFVADRAVLLGHVALFIRIVFEVEEHFLREKMVAVVVSADVHPVAEKTLDGV